MVRVVAACYELVFNIFFLEVLPDVFLYPVSINQLKVGHRGQGGLEHAKVGRG
jgi:hypothetical protein